MFPIAMRLGLELDDSCASVSCFLDGPVPLGYRLDYGVFTVTGPSADFDVMGYKIEALHERILYLRFSRPGTYWVRFVLFSREGALLATSTSPAIRVRHVDEKLQELQMRALELEAQNLLMMDLLEERRLPDYDAELDAFLST